MKIEYYDLQLDIGKYLELPFSEEQAINFAYNNLSTLLVLRINQHKVKGEIRSEFIEIPTEILTKLNERNNSKNWWKGIIHGSKVIENTSDDEIFISFKSKSGKELRRIYLVSKYEFREKRFKKLMD